MDSHLVFLGLWLLAALIAVFGLTRLLAFGAGTDAHLREPRPQPHARSWAALRVVVPVALTTVAALLLAETAISPESQQGPSVTRLQADLSPGVVQLAEPPARPARPRQSARRVRPARTRRAAVSRPQTALVRFTTPAPAPAANPAPQPAVRQRLTVRRLAGRRPPPRRPGTARPAPAATPAPAVATPAVATPAVVSPPPARKKAKRKKAGKPHPVHGTSPGQDGQPGPPPGRGKGHGKKK